LVAPWNGGSGFYPGDAHGAVDQIAEATHSRLAAFTTMIRRCRDLVQRMGLKSKPEKGGSKTTILIRCRNEFPDEALAWLDAAYMLIGGDSKFPPLLGTGGNDGRLEFTNNFMQRVVDVVDPQTGAPRASSAAWLEASLLGRPAAGLTAKAAIGQFSPGASGGANAEAGYEAESLTNPWDFILMLEGALLFSAAAARRLGTSEAGALSYPFTVRSTGAGYGSAALQDAGSSRAETWMPLWSHPVKLGELQALLCEGRANVGRRQARVGVDFARAVAGLGVDRGITV
jgi:CRISPR-associated protein Csx17